MAAWCSKEPTAAETGPTTAAPGSAVETMAGKRLVQWRWGAACIDEEFGQLGCRFLGRQSRSFGSCRASPSMTCSQTELDRQRPSAAVGGPATAEGEGMAGTAQSTSSRRAEASEAWVATCFEDSCSSGRSVACFHWSQTRDSAAWNCSAPGAGPCLSWGLGCSGRGWAASMAPPSSSSEGSGGERHRAAAFHSRGHATTGLAGWSGPPHQLRRQAGSSSPKRAAHAVSARCRGCSRHAGHAAG
jgi:hypothetical protein